MRALQQSSFKGTKDMRLIEAPVPVPGAGEILVRVAAAGVNFADVSRAYGTFLDGPKPPYVAGFEAAGEIVAAGAGVEGVRLGSSVVGVGVGAFAEYLLMRAAAAMPVPPGWTAAQALGLMVNFPTALAALKPLGRLAVGETVLIHAAAGATGQAALKIAKHYGARVIAAASPRKHQAVGALGADHVLDSGREDLAAEVRQLTSGSRIRGRRRLQRQLGGGQASDGASRGLRTVGWSSFVQQLGSDLSTPGPSHRPQYRHVD
jgi:NADPH2:quinone reductase